ncbi:mono/diheme cytochrome c family protein [Mucilaginibacter gracilis]|uniref:Mono/diheme cytochrome c family protein n=1 Tax=Mucilaginibacter gracilis TaxID=423350 RepID=A0A495J414_9SPHI|nr:cytochrome c [Mucilaginibacter gracilis]RKR83725.1 mono/diheme cytochrome c family protein [Mucilaginibacter gracilis]
MKSRLIIATCLFTFISLQIFAQVKKTASKAPAGLSAQVAAGQKVYLQYCLSCHMMDGGGVPNMNPPLINTSYVKGDKTKLIKIVLNGFAQNVDIDGQSYSNNMPAQVQLTDKEVADVLTYVRNSFGNKYSGVKLAEVKAVRATNKK